MASPKLGGGIRRPKGPGLRPPHHPSTSKALRSHLGGKGLRGQTRTALRRSGMNRKQIRRTMTKLNSGRPKVRAAGMKKLRTASSGTYNRRTTRKVMGTARRFQPKRFHPKAY